MIELLIVMAMLEWISCVITPCDLGVDEFGIEEMYPTKFGGREWFMDMQDPVSDGIFDPRTSIVLNSDGSWRVSGEDNGKYQVRMNVNTPRGFEEWKNVEITGYARIVASFPPYQDHNALTWYARGGLHTAHDPCAGTSLKGRLHAGGYSDWIKEIWHTGGYTGPLAHANATDPIMNRWVGWKVAIYNVNNDTAVRMESYIDIKANNTWTKVAELTDDGGWNAASTDAVFDDADCGKPKDYIVTNSGPIVTFRSDKIVWDFKNLSVREIAPSPALAKTS